MTKENLNYATVLAKGPQVFMHIHKSTLSF